MKTKASLSVVTLSLLALMYLCGLTASAQNQVTPQPTSSAVPSLIRYSGSLKDANGAPFASQTIGVIFSIYKDAEGGAAVWSETRNLNTTATGQYTVLLGSTKTEGLPAALFSEQEQRWLGVQVQGQSEQPRVLLVSVPYAFKAHEAETLGGLPPSAFVKAATDATSGVAADAGFAVNALNTTGNQGKTAVSGNPPLVNCSTVALGRVPIWSVGGGSPTLCNSGIYQPGFPTGFVGILQITPLETLDVNGAPVGGGPPSGINTTNNKKAYMIGRNTVLSVFGTDNLFTGVGAGAVNSGQDNTFLGYLAGNSNAGGTSPAGSYNTFSGSQAGLFNKTGFQNTFSGYTAGYGNITGYQNSCFGSAACLHNTTGIENVAVGAGAGFRNTTGSQNTYVGFDSGWTFSGNINNNTFTGFESGFNNTASNGSFYGYQAGYNNTADGNSFFGYQAGYDTTSGASNTYVGYIAGAGNAAGGNNTAVGYAAGLGGGSSNVSIGLLTGYGGLGSDNVVIGRQAALGGAGNSNVIIGAGAVYDNPVNDNNTFIGANVDYNSLFSDNNIFIGANTGTQGSTMNDIYLAARCSGCDNDHPENNTTRIGTEGTQTDAYMAGVYNSTPGGANQGVCVDATGKLWGTTGTCNTSSLRFKDQIADMGDSSSKLLQLRPVTFLYKPQYDDGSHSLQYGLIAEEVAKVYPEMVVYDKEGQPYSVKYQLLAPMLLSELQKQHTVVTAQQAETKSQRLQIKAQQLQMLAQQQEIEGLKSQLQLQNAAFQERLSRLESLVTTQLQTATDKPTPAPTPATGNLQ